MDEEYMDAQDSVMNEVNTRSEGTDIVGEPPKDVVEVLGYDESYDDDEGNNSFRGGRGRGNFRGRGRGPPPGWMNGPPPPMRFRGRGYGPGGPPMRGRGFFRGRGGPRFGPNSGPGFDGNWGPMGPPPGMMGGPPPYGPPPGMMPPGGPMGPPPNMMGQPPPFAGPPGMPPQNMPAPELWVETKSDEGKPYYYHSRTRETTWTRPMESPTCKVITQAEMEAMSTQAPQMHNMNGPQSMMGGPPMGGPPMGGPPMGMMNGMMPGGMMPPGVAPGPAQGSVPPFMTQPPPWLKDGNGKEKHDSASPVDSDEAPPGDVAPTGQPNGGGGFPGPWGNWGWPPPGVVGQQAMAAGGNSGATGATASAAPAAIPDKGAATQPPYLSAAPVVAAEPGDSGALPAKKEETTIPPELAAQAAEWTAHKAPDGRPYYYNASKQESVWEKPQPMRELEELQAKIAIEKGEVIEKKVETVELEDGRIEVIDVDEHAEAQAAAAAAAEASRRAAEREREREREREQAEREQAEREKAEREKAEREKAEREKAKQDRSRPRWSTPISGTPWCVVWTGDGRVFFYNPTANSSVWERPPQLVGRADVDKAVSQPPVELQREEGAAPAAAATGGAAANGDLKRAADTDTDDSEPEPAKKAKPDEGKKTASVGSGGVIDAGKEAAVEAEIRAARERALLPFEQRVRSFLQMLHESEVSAFSPWEKELHKIVFDSRYLLLTSKERKQVFDKYVRERAEEERKEKKNRLQQKKNAFRQLMEEAKLHSKSSFSDFSSKHGRDERFKGIEKVRDREKYFNEYILEVRKKEKEEKDRKKEQVKTDFLALLKEKSVGRHSRWAEAKKKIDTEPRYKAVEGSALREDYFREYCKQLKDERKKEKDGKEKERERGSSKKEKKDKDRDKEKEKDGKEKKKKEKAGDKQSDQSAEEEKRQPTPPPDQWAEILGIPGEGGAEGAAGAAAAPSRSPKRLRSSKREPAAPAGGDSASPLKSPPKKRRPEQPDEAPAPEPGAPPAKAEKPEKPEKKRRKKSEKD